MIYVLVTEVEVFTVGYLQSFFLWFLTQWAINQQEKNEDYLHDRPRKLGYEDIYCISGVIRQVERKLAEVK